MTGCALEPHLISGFFNSICRFLVRNYEGLIEEDGPFDVMLCAVGFDLEIKRPSEADLWSGDPAESAVLLHQREVLALAFAGWARSAKPNAVAACAFRISSSGDLWTFASAAAHAGWKVEVDSLHRVNGGAGNLIAAWRMVREEQSVPEASDLIALLKGFVKRLPAGSLAEPEALNLVRYLCLSNRKVLLRRSRKFDDGHWMRCEIGQHADGGYTLWSATTGYFELKLTTSEEAAKLTLRLPEVWLRPESLDVIP